MNTHLINREGREGIASLRLSPSIIDCVVVVQFENAASTFLIYASKELEGWIILEGKGYVYASFTRALNGP